MKCPIILNTQPPAEHHWKPKIIEDGLYLIVNDIGTMAYIIAVFNCKAGCFYKEQYSSKVHPIQDARFCYIEKLEDDNPYLK